MIEDWKLASGKRRTLAITNDDVGDNFEDDNFEHDYAITLITIILKVILRTILSSMMLEMICSLSRMIWFNHKGCQGLGVECFIMGLQC